MAWALFSLTDNAGCTLLNGNKTASLLSGGYARLDTFVSSGKRRIEFTYDGGTAKIAVALGLNVAVPTPANTANFWMYDGTGYFGHLGFDGGGHATIGAFDVVGLNWDADAGTIYFDINGVVIAGQPAWAGILGSMSCSFAPTTTAGCQATIQSDPALFAFPVGGYTGFGSAPPAAGGNFLPLI